MLSAVLAARSLARSLARSAEQQLLKLNSDLDFLKEQITISEVTIARFVCLLRWRAVAHVPFTLQRVHNHRVKMRQQQQQQTEAAK